MVGRAMQACILRGTHRYERGAIELGRPLVEELCKRGINAELRDVPAFAADRHLDKPQAHHMFMEARAQWWRKLAREEKQPIFSLHNYPYDQPAVAMRYGNARAIGRIKNTEGKFDIYIIERMGFLMCLKEGPGAVLRTLAQLRRNQRSVWEDGSLFFSSIIEIPAVPDKHDANHLNVDLERSKAAGFVDGTVVRTIAEEIGRITGTGRRH